MRRITKRTAASLAVLALSASAAGAASSIASASTSTSTSASAVVSAHIDRSGTTVVSGYDGGAPLAPAPGR